MRFRFRPFPTALVLVVSAACVRLGVWQIHRYQESQEVSATMTAAADAAPVDGLPLHATHLAHRRVMLRGAWLDEPPSLMTGGVVAGQPGYRLLAVLRQDDGPDVVVDRGWVPVGLDAAALAALRVDGPVVIEGLVLPADDEPGAAKAPQLGDDGVRRWPLRTDLAYGVFPRVLGPPWGAMIRAREAPTADAAVVVGPRLEHEADRRPGPPPIPGYVLPLPRTHHLSYAAQWFAFAGLALLVLAWMSRDTEGSAP